MSREERVVADYELLGVVARGRLGALHRARQISLDREVLIRLVSGRIARDREARGRLLALLQAVGRLPGVEIVRPIDQGTFEGQLFYAMELVDGVELDRLAVEGASKRFGRASLWERVQAMIDLLRCMGLLAGEGFDLHGLKQGEVLLTAPFRFVLSEPCLARTIAGGKSRKGADGPAEFRALIDACLQVSLDPIWDTNATRSLAKRGGHLMRTRSLPEVRQGLIEELAALDDRDATTLVHELADGLERRMNEARAPSDSRFASSSGSSSSRWKRPRGDALFKQAVAAILSVATLIFLVPVFVGGVQPQVTDRERVLDEAIANDDLEGVRLWLAESVVAHEQGRGEAAVDLLLGRRVDRVLAGLLDRIARGDEPELEELPALDDESVKAAVEPSLAGLRERAGALAGLFGTDSDSLRLSSLDLVLASRGQLTEDVIRVALVECLEDESRELRSRAAAGLAAGVGGSPTSLDETLARYLIDEVLRPEIVLALVGYFANLGPDRAEDVLTQVCLNPLRDCPVQNPDADAWIVRLYSSVNRSPEVLKEWIGWSPESVLGARLHLRESALRALEHCGSERALTHALSLALSTEEGMARVASEIIERKAHELDAQQCRELYRKASSGDNVAVQSTLLGALGELDPEAALAEGLERLEQVNLGSGQREMILESLLTEEVIGSVDRLRELLEALSLGDLRVVARAASEVEQLGLWNRELFDSPDRDLREKTALVSGLSGTLDERGFAELRDAFETTAPDEEAYVLLLEALASSGHERAIPTLLTVVEDPARTVVQRRGALFQVWQQLDIRESAVSEAWASQTDRRINRVLASLSALLRDREPELVFWAAEMLSLFDHPLALDGMSWLLEQDLRDDVLRRALQYFTLYGGPTQHARMRELGQDPAIRERLLELMRGNRGPEVQLEVLEFFRLAENDDVVTEVAEELMVFGHPEVEATGLRYLAPYVEREEVQTAIGELLEFASKPWVAILALETLESQRPPGVESIYQEIVSSGDDPRLVLRSAAALDERGVPFDLEGVFGALRVLLDPSIEITITFDARTPRELELLSRDVARSILLDLGDEDFTQAIARWIVDMEFESDRLIEPFALLMLRLHREGSGPELLLDVLDAYALEEVSDLVTLFETDLVDLEQWGGAPTSSFELASHSEPRPFWGGHYNEICDYLCEAFPEEPTVFRLRAKIAVAEAFDDVDRSKVVFDASSSQKRDASLRSAASDFETAIVLRDPERPLIRRALAMIHGLLEDHARAVELLENYLVERPGDYFAKLTLCQALVELGDIEAARQLLETIQEEKLDSEEIEAAYFSRRVRVVLAAEEPGALAGVLAPLLARAREAVGSSAYLDTVLRPMFVWGFEHRGDAAPELEPLFEVLATEVMESLADESDAMPRANAATHLGWIGSARSVPILEALLSGDISETVRANAMHSLFLLRPDALESIVITATEDGAQEVRSMALWVLAQSNPERAALIASEWIRSEEVERATAGLLAMAVHDLEDCIPAAEAVLDESREPAQLRLVLSYLWRMAARGHAIDAALVRRVHDEGTSRRVRRGAALVLAAGRNEWALREARRRIQELVDAGVVTTRQRERLAETLLQVSFDTSAETVSVLERLLSLEQELFAELFRGRSGWPEITVNRSDEVWGDLADELIRMDWPEKAEEAYRRAAFLDSDDPEWMSKLATLERGEPVHLEGPVLLWGGSTEITRRLDNLTRIRQALDLARAQREPGGAEEVERTLALPTQGWESQLTEAFHESLLRALYPAQDGSPKSREEVERALACFERYPFFDIAAQLFGWTVFELIPLPTWSLSFPTAFAEEGPIPYLHANDLVLHLAEVARAIEGESHHDSGSVDDWLLTIRGRLSAPSSER